MALALAALLPIAACGGDAPRSAAPASEPAAQAPAPPAFSGSYGVFVTNEESGDLTAIDPATNTVVGTLPLGKRPRGIRVSPDGTRLYAALSGSPAAPPGVDEDTLPPPDKSADGIGVVDTWALKLVTVLKGPSDPEQLSLSKDGGILFVANEDNGKATTLDAATGATLDEFTVGGEPEGVTTSPDGRFVYVTSEEEGNVTVIDPMARKVVGQFPAGARPRDSAFSPDSSRAYVTAENGRTVSVVDTTTHKVIRTIRLEGENTRPMGVVVSPDGKRLYVSTGRGGQVVVLDTASYTVVGTVAVGERPWGIAISPDGTRLYTANGPSNDVSVVDTATLTVVAKVPVGTRPWGIAIAAR
jgi:YVTN family beta-propeller protein